MFNRRFAYQAQANDWNGWTPPWQRNDEQRGPRGPRVFRMWRGRGPFGNQGPFGQHGPFGPEGPFNEGRRFFGRGDVKFALLELLQERPMHGYEMMKALEQRSGGFYAPSAGSIYPTLQMLEDRGLVTVAEAEGKKVYSITDTGRALLAERHKEDDDFTPPWGGRGRDRRGFPEMQALSSEAMEVARLFTIAGRASFRDEAKMAQLRSVLERTRKELSDLIYGSGTEKNSSEPGK